ncbi:hypothetical protein Ddye_002196 [Dipteronia dyeriana]|uniref:Cytochrome P450 n=1 Tax=Dipteronia dyeriana TaxID=168575 RepID=A0AAD9XQG4_9ROSI|nr:hypothetical protein Ddye_002196 [Dipteronia dyeriana]
MKTHDVIFANTPHSRVTKRLLYNYRDLLWFPYGEYWRQMRYICVMRLLNAKRVRKYDENEGESGRKLKKLLEELGEILGVFNVEDFIPCLGWLDQVSDLNAKIERVFLQRLWISATYTVIKWAMTEIVRHTEIIKKVHEEIRGIAMSKLNIDEHDLEKMLYLRAVI